MSARKKRYRPTKKALAERDRAVMAAVPSAMCFAIEPDDGETLVAVHDGWLFKWDGDKWVRCDLDSPT